MILAFRENSYSLISLFVAALCCRTFHDHCIMFVQTKIQAHRLHIILGLFGLNVGELHGNLSQAQVMNRAQFHRAAKHKNLLSMKLLP